MTATSKRPVRDFSSNTDEDGREKGARAKIKLERSPRKRFR